MTEEQSDLEAAITSSRNAYFAHRAYMQPTPAFLQLFSDAFQLGADYAMDAESQTSYSMDADPQGIRAMVADTISGALAFGAQGVNPPPEGHWLTPFWNAARADAAPQPNAALADGWVKTKDDLPKCSKKRDSLGIEVLIWPPHEDGSITAFYGRRQSSAPNFYKYGAILHHVEFWTYPPAPPTLNASKDQS